MFNFGCTNGRLNEVNYSSPVPVVGVYIAIASLVCLLLMVYDVISAGILPRMPWLPYKWSVLPKKPWFPCKWFTLNSVTLALLSVAAKLTVDTTTPMPSRWDQLSKLSGTAFICIGMGFMVPSIGVNGEFECLTNMMALTIFVITVTVNISIQISTGVIYMLIVEHIIILGLMIILLLMLWHISFKIKKIKRIDAAPYASKIKEGSDSMLDRLKRCFVHAYCSNPQLKISVFPVNLAVGSLCVACTAIIMEAAFRSLIKNKLEFCEGVSDYRWSMPYIVIIQILTALLGCFPIFARGVVMFLCMDLEEILVPFLPGKDHVKQMKQTLKAKGMKDLHGLLHLFESIITGIVLIAQLLILSPLLLLRCFPCSVKDVATVKCFRKYGDDAVNKVTRCDCFHCYSVRKSIDEISRLRNQVSVSIHQPSRYLSQRSRSKIMDLKNMRIKHGAINIWINALNMALLVKVAEASIAKDHLVTLVNTFKEAKEVIDYIYKAIQRHNVETQQFWGDFENWAYTRALWIGGDLRCVLTEGYPEPSTDPRVAIATMEKLKEILCEGEVWWALAIVIIFIKRKSYSSIEDLCGEIEQLFVDMLHGLFAQLPNAIFYNISNTEGEEYEENVRLAMKLLFKIQSYEYQRGWLFPAKMKLIGHHAPRKMRDDPPWCFDGELEELEKIVLDRGDDGVTSIPPV